MSFKDWAAAQDNKQPSPIAAANAGKVAPSVTPPASKPADAPSPKAG